MSSITSNIGFIKRMQAMAWRFMNPRKNTADYYAYRESIKISKGQRHSSLRAGNQLQDFDSKSQRLTDSVFQNLIDLGLKKHHKIIDYGCGSLRIGKPLIEYLEPNNYTGLDVVDIFYLAALRMLDDDLVSLKKPQLAIISPEVLKKTSKSPPDFIFSFTVTQHVPTDELGSYFTSVLSIMGPKTICWLHFIESEEITQNRAVSWSYPRSVLIDQIKLLDPSLSVIAETNLGLPYDPSRGRWSCALKISSQEEV